MWKYCGGVRLKKILFIYSIYTMEWKNLNKTQKTNYFKSKLNKGLCRSLKNERKEDFDDFMELFKYHPQFKTKLINVVDLSIINNKRNNKFFEINLIKLNGDTEDISYRCCINERNNNYNLNQALRYAIQPQIQQFRNSNELKCEFCGSIDNIHIDHIIMFKNLAKDFLSSYEVIPSEFDDNEYNGAKFKLEDNKFEKDWFNYHQEKAKLRSLCAKCNQSRKHD